MPKVETVSVRRKRTQVCRLRERKEGDDNKNWGIFDSDGNDGGGGGAKGKVMQTADSMAENHLPKRHSLSKNALMRHREPQCFTACSKKLMCCFGPWWFSPQRWERCLKKAPCMRGARFGNLHDCAARSQVQTCIFIILHAS